MIPFRRILFPVDFSDASRSIVPYVKGMSEHFGAELTLMHAYQPPAVLYGELGPADLGWPELAHKVEERLEKFADEFFPGATLLLEEGGPGDAIPRVVERQGIDLVMMTTHGHGPFRRMLLGSVAAKVLHDAGCSIWTAAPAARTAHWPVKSMVCALPWDGEAQGVAMAAASLAKSFDARLALMHAVEVPPPTFELDVTPFREQLRAGAKRFLTTVQEEAAPSAEIIVVDGHSTASLVRDEAEKRAADLVVVGRGHAQARLSFLSSGLYGIVRESVCPVLSM